MVLDSDSNYKLVSHGSAGRPPPPLLRCHPLPFSASCLIQSQTLVNLLSSSSVCQGRVLCVVWAVQGELGGGGDAVIELIAQLVKLTDQDSCFTYVTTLCLYLPSNSGYWLTL